MRIRMMLVGLAVVAVAALFASRVWGSEPRVGEKATFSYRTTDGKLVTPETVSGHIVVFDFWATWCGPCMQMAPHMVELNKTYANNGVAIIGVSLDDDGKSMADVARQQGFTWPQICDGKGWGNAFAVAWGVQSIPHCVILAPDGTVAWSGHPGNIDAPLKQLVAKYPYTPKEPAAVKTEAAPTSVTAVAAVRSGGATVAPAVLDARIAAAARDKAAGKNVEAYEGYKWVATRAPETPQAQSAQEQVATYEGDAKFMAVYKKTLRDRDAASTLWLAKSLEQSDKSEQARGYYTKIVNDFSDTPSAVAAKEALERLK